MTSLNKKIIFSFITFVFFVLVLTLIEIVLRISMPSLKNSLVHETISDGIESYEINRGYLKKYFSSGAPIIPELKPTIFRKQKTENTFRILCLGESSMLGTPYQLNANIPGIVRKQLRHLYPGKEFEVINLGAAAINSNVILDLTKQIFEFQPDLILIYTGHNEFYGPEGVGASWIQKNFPSTIPIKYALNDLYLLRFIDDYILSPSNPKKAGERNLMRQVSQSNSIHLNSEAADRIFTLFKSNMSEIVSLIQEHNVPLIISDVSSNLMFPPFVYDTSESLRKQYTSYAKLLQAFESGNYADMKERALSLHQLDSSNAFINYVIGEVMLGEKKYDQAKYFLTVAKDEDLLKFRAPSEINKIQYQIAQVHHIPFISADSLFASLESDSIPGDNLFREHLHPNARGYYEIANLFIKKIQQLNLVTDKGASNKILLPFNHDSLSIPWLDLAYGDISIRQLTTQWPFQNYSATMYVMNTADNVLQKIALDVYSLKTNLIEGCYETATHFQQTGKYRDALTTYEYLIEEYPNSYYPYYLAGVNNKESGNIEEAIRYYSLSLQKNPTYLYAHLDLGLIKINTGLFDEAIEHFQKAEHSIQKEKISSSVKATLYYGLSAAYANKNDLTQALRYINESLRCDPEYKAAQDLSNKLRAL